MPNEHAHDHGHAGHSHASGASNLRLAFFFNLAFTLIEIAGGLWTNSLAVLSDAFHDMGDVLVLGAAWYLSHLAVRGRDGKYSYGYGRYGMLGGWLTSLVLAIGALVLMGFTLSKITRITGGASSSVPSGLRMVTGMSVLTPPSCSRKSM